MKHARPLYQLTACALMAAILCVLGPMSLPIGPIPITLGTLAVYLSASILGMRGSFLSVLIYLLLGAAGMPVFSGYAGGLAKLVGPTGGYLAGYLVVAVIGGCFADIFSGKMIPTAIGLILGTAVLYFLGTLWFLFQTQSTVAYALSVCVYPFIPFDLGKILFAAILGKTIRAGLVRAHLFTE